MAETNRGTTWADKEVKALLTIWGDSKIQEELDGAVCNKVVRELQRSFRSKDTDATGSNIVFDVDVGTLFNKVPYYVHMMCLSCQV